MNRIEQLTQKIKDLYELKNAGRADWSDWLYENHVFLVAEEARSLAERFGVNPEIAQAAGMLHDIADAVMSRADDLHEEKSAEIARIFLNESGFNEEEMKIIVDDAMKYHGCHNGEYPESLEGKVMATADAVVHLATDFYPFAKQAMEESKSIEEIRSWALPKIERDYNDKILFPEIRQEQTRNYENAKQLFSG